MRTKNGRIVTVVLALALGAAESSMAASLVRCESIEGKPQVCAMDTTWGVQLARQLGGSACEAGKSWGWSPGSVWVEENCRGEFRNVYEKRAGEAIITCDSDHNQVQRCRLATQAGFVIVVDDSSSKCVQGKTWGWEVGSVWVSRRCEADFAVVAPDLGRSVLCEAPEGQRMTCEIDPVGGVSVIGEHRSTPCVFGQNWGVSAEGIWVDAACGATFLVDGRVRGTRYWSQPTSLVCGRSDGERAFCAVDTSNGVYLGTEAGSGACAKDVSWGWTAQGIWTANGCLAEFRLGHGR